MRLFALSSNFRRKFFATLPSRLPPESVALHDVVHALTSRRLMDEDTSKTTKTVWLWAIGLNLIAWSGYLVLTRVMGVTFNSVP